ncbi:MAG: acetylxylan esterase [Anaerolineae bacterium]|nr:acetylxylan esterase [Anaerolineae bacterium]
MSQDTSGYAQSVSRDRWNQARRQAFWQKLSGALGFSRQPLALLSFEEVQQKLRLKQSAYRGLQQVDLDKIVGSVGRYHDFTRTFLPLVESDGPRWQRVAELQWEQGLPPIELYKVGDVYFVKDGNHRVSVARQFGATTIEAYVWEYETPVGGLSADVDDLIVKAEYRAFLDRTRLDMSHPGLSISLTEPGMYPELELEIELYRRNLERIDGEPHSYEAAAADWYDMIYTLAVDIIRESGVLDLFPGRTEADLYVWVMRHRRELSEQYGESVHLRDVVAQLAERQQRPGTWERIVQTAARSVRGLVSGLSPAGSELQDSAAFLIPPADDQPLGKLMAEMGTFVPEMAYRGQRGEAWREWRSALRAKVADLLNLQTSPGGTVAVEIAEQTVVSGVERTKLYFEALDGLPLPAYVLKPAGSHETLPGLVVFTGHGTIRQTVGLDAGRQQANALALAQAGYVTLTFEERGFGELGQVDHESLDSAARLLGRTWLAMTLEDGLRALDYLQTRPDVKPTHLGATGLGLGGGLALYLAALDERVRAVVIQNYVGGGIDVLAVQGHGCDFVPGLRRYADFSDVARLIVPRPVLYAYPQGRSLTFLVRGWFDRTRPMYEVFSCPDRLRFVEHEMGDRYDNAIARFWFDRWLAEEEDTSVLLWAPRE